MSIKPFVKSQGVCFRLDGQLNNSFMDIEWHKMVKIGKITYIRRLLCLRDVK